MKEIMLMVEKNKVCFENNTIIHDLTLVIEWKLWATKGISAKDNVTEKSGGTWYQPRKESDLCFKIFWHFATDFYQQRKNLNDSNNFWLQ